VPRQRKRVPLAERVRSAGTVSWALIGMLLLIYAFLRFVVKPVSVVLPPVIIAAVLAYLLNPVVSWLERKGLKRGFGVAIVFVVFLGVVTTTIILLEPIIARQVSSLLENIPDYAQKVANRFNELAVKYNVKARITVPSDLGALIQENRGTIFKFLGGVRSFAGQILHIMINVVLGLVLSVYFLIDLPRIRSGLVKAVPPDYREDLVEIGQKVSTAVGGFFRGQLLVALFVGVASAVLLTWPVKLPFAVVVGLLAGVFNLIPLIGPFLAAVPAIIIGLLSGDPIKAVWASLALLAVQQIDNHIISPNVMGRTVKLHPITVMLGLLAGSALAGIPGMLIVIPTIASAKIVFAHLWQKRRDLGVPESIADAGS
jgi:predicted PurR-regulated permease PerM